MATKVNVSARTKNLIRIALVGLLSVGVAFNSLYFGSWVVGLPLSVTFFLVVSTAFGEVFFFQENRFFRTALGFAAFLALTALVGSVLIISAQFNRVFSLVMVSAIGLIFSVLPLRIKGAYEEQTPSLKTARKLGGSKLLYLASSGFVVCVAVAFYALAMARTGEGVTSVWLTIPDYFLPVFFLCSLILTLIILFTRSNAGLKLSLVFLYSFLAESLFWIVWYPGRYGDPWQHLGAARFIDKTGMPYAYSWMINNRLILDLIKGKAHYAPLVLWTNMFTVDIYWVHILLIPFLWSFLLPLFSYKLAETLAKAQSEKFSLLTAFLASLFPSLVLWGAVSVSNSVGFILFFFVIFLMLYWVRTGKREILVLSLLVTAATFFAHELPGIFSLVFILMVLMFKGQQAIGKVISYVALFLAYPLGLYLVSAQFSLAGLLNIEGFDSLQSVIVTAMTLFALLGVVLSLRSRHVERGNVFLVFAFYVMIILEYYLTNYGMLRLPFGASRLLVMADFLLLPFVALGVIEGVNILVKVFSRLPPKVSPSKKVNPRLSPKSLGFALICLALSAQAILSLNQAYPRQEIVSRQPAVYMMNAVYYINSTAPGPYVVLCDTQFANIAIGLLGIDYGWAGGMKGMFGIPEYTYPTIAMYSRMARAPSPSIMQTAIDFTGWAKVAYFVVEITDENTKKVVDETSAILPVDAVFGDGRLYIFKYLMRESPLVEGVGPKVQVSFDDGNSSEVETSFLYVFQSDVRYTVSLSGHSSYKITGYPKHWAFQQLMIDDEQEEFDQSSDINEFIYVSQLEPTRVLNVTWVANDLYPNAAWKEDSFKSIGVDWQKHPDYGTIFPNITTDGNILTISWDFVQGVYPDNYQVFYYLRSANVSTNDYNRIIVRWRSTGPVAAVATYYGSQADEIVPFGSESTAWQTTVAPLSAEKTVTSVLAGITNLYNTQITGTYSIQVDYVLICA